MDYSCKKRGREFPHILALSDYYKTRTRASLASRGATWTSGRACPATFLRPATIPAQQVGTWRMSIGKREGSKHWIRSFDNRSRLQMAQLTGLQRKQYIHSILNGSDLRLCPAKSQNVIIQQQRQVKPTKQGPMDRACRNAIRGHGILPYDVADAIGGPARCQMKGTSWREFSLHCNKAA